MKWLKSVILAVLVSACSVASAQGLKSTPNIRIDVPKPQPPKPKPRVVKPAQQPKPGLPDTVYSLGTKKQHGWMLPVHEIPEANKDKYQFVMRFSGRLDNGKFTRLDVINAYGDYAPGKGITPYILNIFDVSDSTANQVWKNHLLTVCRYEFMPDPTNSYIVQERAFDAGKNLVYAFSTTPVGDNNFIGTYKDYCGMPAEMRVDPQYTYGTLVKTKRDRFGTDSLIQFIDAKGVAKMNPDGAFFSEYRFDEKGRPTYHLSIDEGGNYIIDQAGNCGFKFIYDENSDFYFPKEQVNLDTNLNPAVCIGENFNELRGTAGCKREYDAYGRQIKESFIDVDGNPCSNFYGAYGYEIKNDDHGNCIEMRGFDADGNLAAFDRGGQARIVFEFDSLGRILYLERCDKFGNLVYLDGYESRAKFEYDSVGSRQYYWQNIGGKEVLTAYYESTPQRQVNQWPNGYCQIDSLDSKGRLEKSTFSFNGVKTKGMAGFSTAVVNYYDGENSNSNIISYYDENDQLCVNKEGNAKQHNCWLNDSTNFVRAYDLDGNLTSSYITVADTLGRLSMQYDSNAFGVKCRAGGSNLAVCYGAKPLYNNDGTLISYIGRDEFGEPDYLLFNNKVYYFSNNDKYNVQTCYDEEGKEITDDLFFITFRPKAVSVEVVDSIGYKRGFRDNDLILRYGDYVNPLSYGNDCVGFYAMWALNAALNAPKKCDVVVFRLDAQTLEPQIVLISDIKGTLSENGILTHRRWLTDKQQSRISNAIWKNSVSEKPLLKHDEFYEMLEFGNNTVTIGYPFAFRILRNKPYLKEIADPSILLAVHAPKKGEVWCEGDNIEELQKLLVNVGTKNVNEYYVSTDGVNTKKLESTEDPMAGWLLLNVDDEMYAKVLKLSKKAAKDINVVKDKRKKVDKQKLLGNWSADGETSFTNMEMKENLRLEIADNEVTYVLTQSPVTQLDMNTKMHAVYEVRFNLDWRLNKNTIVFGNEKRDVKVRLIDAYLSGQNTSAWIGYLRNYKENMSNLDDEQKQSKMVWLQNMLSAPLLDLEIEEIDEDYFRSSNSRMELLFQRQE